MPDIETDAAEIDSIQYFAQANDAAVTTPSAGLVKRYTVGNEFRQKNSAGSVLTFGGADATELTIASGAITRTQLYHKVDTEADAASDDLDTISGGVAGQELILRADNTGRTVVVRDTGGGSGNIRTNGLGDVSLDDTNKHIRLIFDGTNWLVTAFAIGASGLSDYGGTPDNTAALIVQDTVAPFTQYSSNVDDFKKDITANVTGDISRDSSSLFAINFNSATARTVTINTSTIARGHSVTVTVQTAPGAGSHRVLLPSGVTWDGTNNAADFDNVADILWAKAVSTTRFMLLINVGVTYSVV